MGTYRAAAAWGGNNPWPVPLFVLTHHPEAEPADRGFTFVNGFDNAVAQALEAAGGKDVHVMGGADVIRQALRAGVVEQLSMSVSPVILGGGKRLFEGFDDSIDLEQIRVLHSPLATHITYRVRR